MAVVAEPLQELNSSNGNVNGRSGGSPSWSVLPTLPAKLPIGNISDDVNIAAIAEDIVQQFPALSTTHFTPDALWRDSFALTGTLRTFYTAASILKAWRDVASRRNATEFVLTPDRTRIVRLGIDSSWIEIFFTFKTVATPRTTCSGMLSVVQDVDGLWKIWVLRTILEQLEGSEDVDFLKPVVQSNGHVNGTDGAADPSHFDCVVVGAGQAGLSTGGRLKALGLSYVVIDKVAEVGDNWKLRYDSARLHTTREYAHLPFERTFTPDYQEFLTKDDLSKGYQHWVETFGVNVWLSTPLESGSWNQDQKLWKLKIRRNGKAKEITSMHVVLAVGAGCQIPLMPHYPNKELFKGTILHSNDYNSARGWKGKNGIVVGTANTAHDVGEDMVEVGMSSVTMLQRARTYVLPIEYFLKFADVLYNSTIPTDTADRLQFSNPIAVSRLIAMKGLNGMASQQPERFDALERAGFKVERYGDIMHHISERLGGHYIDVGASAKIAAGLIKVKSDAFPISYTSSGLKFSDGSEIAADVIVFATGFLGNMRQVVGSLFGEEVQSQVQDFWGLNPEGELHGAFMPTGHPALWYMGGAIGHARYFSRFVALQIKADLLGTRLPLYSKETFPKVSK